MSKDTNAALYDRARKVIPGGVNSPVRAFRAVGGTPRFMARGEGAVGACFQGVAVEVHRAVEVASVGESKEG